MSTPKENKPSEPRVQKPAKEAVPAPPKFSGGASAFFGNSSQKGAKMAPRGAQGGSGLRQRRSQRGR
ncbi:MAG: hypothetical protein ACKV19_20705 [Verrucomicrobiales bacterium]